MNRIIPQPDEAAFAAALKNHNLVPVHTSILADLDTPLTLFAKVWGDAGPVFLFESVEGGEKWGRYSFIGFDPLLTFESRGEDCRVAYPGMPGRAEEKRRGNPLHLLREIMSGFSVAEPDGLPRFYGGLVGYLGYDMVRFIEKIPDRHAGADPEALPDSALFIPRMLLIHDRIKQRLTIVCNVFWEKGGPHPLPLSQRERGDFPPSPSGRGGQGGEGPPTSPAALYKEALARIDAAAARLRGPLPPSFRESRPTAPHVFQNLAGEGAYQDMVRRAKEHILAGDIIQVVPSQRFAAEAHVDPFTLYRALRQVNPSPYLFCLRHMASTLVGSSPEILVRLEDGQIEVRPIAGTRKRGADPEEDAALERELLADEKERAEHLMLVDLGRNDVGRVSALGTVGVPDLLTVERYSHVMHLVSDVRGRLAPGRDQFDVFAACFPAGTVSGAPKIRAMEIIDELEPCRRGPYAGAVGYFGFSGNMDFCITLRTCVHTGKTLWVQAGAGIVADSDPQREHEETVNKSLAVRRAVELAERGL